MTTKHNRPTGANGRAATAANDTTFQRQYSSSTPVRSTPVRRADGRIVGELAGDVLRKTAKREHQLRTPPGWAWDCDILDAAERAGARFTEVECDGRIWRATLADFRRYPIPVNCGYGAQVALALIHWHVRRVGEPPAAVQLSLFEVAR